MTRSKRGSLPRRILLGPGPSDVHPRVLRAMAQPIIGHLDPAFLALMDETTELLRQVFQTTNRLTIPISGTGSAGLEAAVCNVLEPDDTLVVGVHGVFGQRLAEVAGRYGANVVQVEGEWGKPIDPERFLMAVKGQNKAKAVAIVHAETSTGVLQPLQEISRIAHDAGALFLVDAVTSAGGVDLRVDEWGIDVCYSGTQKCIGATPGLSPITFGPRALEVVNARKTKVTSWYLDMTLLQRYWGTDRVYHHTAPISMVYGLNEALHIVFEEGLLARHARHKRHAEALWAGLKAMGLTLIVEPQYRAYPLTTVHIPLGVDDAKVRGDLLNRYGIEIGGGLGVLRAKAWRIGLMGYGSLEANVITLLGALERVLGEQGFDTPRGASVAAAQKSLKG